MDAAGKIRRGVELFRRGKMEEYLNYARGIREQDQLAGKILDVSVMALQFRSPEAIKKGTRLLSAVSGRPDLAHVLFNALGIAYSMMGEIETSENYHLRDLEASEAIKDRNGFFRARVNLIYIRFCRGEYESLYREIKEALKKKEFPDDYFARYHLALLELIRGNPERVLGAMNALMQTQDMFYYFGSMEIEGLALRLMGRFHEALARFQESAEGLVKMGAAYSAFPCAKALELSRMVGLPGPSRGLTAACLRLGRKGSWGEQAAAMAIESLLEPDEETLCSLLFEAAQGYKRAYHLFESFTSALLAARVSWQTEGPLFARILRFLSHLVPLYPGFRKDPLLGGFLAEIHPLLTSETRQKNKEGIRAYLIGDMRVMVDGRELAFRDWRRKKAIRAFTYLLLTPKHRLPQDHLFYLLWPGRKYDERSRDGFYSVIYTIRKNIGKSGYLTRRRDFYQLEEVWTDLDEIEALVRRADATVDSYEREELLSVARELARDELLPEIIDDHYVDEYRQYYNRLRKRITDRT